MPRAQVIHGVPDDEAEEKLRQKSQDFEAAIVKALRTTRVSWDKEKLDGNEDELIDGETAAFTAHAGKGLAAILAEAARREAAAAAADVKPRRRAHRFEEG